MLRIEKIKVFNLRKLQFLNNEFLSNRQKVSHLKY